MPSFQNNVLFIALIPRAYIVEFTTDIDMNQNRTYFCFYMKGVTLMSSCKKGINSAKVC